MAGGFDSLGLMPELLKAVDDMSWILPTDVQDEAIPLILGGGDVMVASETGSGKTAAFCLPILQCVYERQRERKVSETPVAEAHSHDQLNRRVTLNPNDKDPVLLLTNNNCGCISNADKRWVGARATHGVKSGIYAYECIIQGSASGICRIGWSTALSKLELGMDAHGFGYGGTAKKSNSGTFQDYGEKYAVGDIITSIVNWNNRTISFAKNGVLLGTAFDIPVSTSALYPAIAIKGGGGTFTFDTSNFKYPAILSDARGISEATVADITASSIKNDLTTNAKSSKRSPLAVIIEPARDLAEQVYDNLSDLSQYIVDPDVRSMLLVGGEIHKKQKHDVAGGADIIVGTTGKLVDLVKSKAIDFSRIKFFVLDEADRLIETDNLDNIMYLYNACHHEGKGGDRLQVCFFSATLHSPAITDLADKICFQPTWVDLKGVDSVPETVHHVIYKVDLTKDISAFFKHHNSLKTFTDNVHTNGMQGDERQSQIVKELKQKALISIIDKFEMSQCMVFCRTNQDCDNLEEFLNTASGGGKSVKKFTGKIDTGKENQYSCCVLAGMRSLQERRQSLDAFRDGYVRILICTDVAARGIDIKGLPYVINMTLPDVAENYIHRIGRVGRADLMGLAISIVATDVKEKVWYHSNCANRGKGCTNRSLLDQGGCTIWYDEGACLAAVEARLKTSIPSLLEDFSLPLALAEKQIEYGVESSKLGKKESAASLHLSSLAPTVKELAQLEIMAQNSYFYMQTWNQNT